MTIQFLNQQDREAIEAKLNVHTLRIKFNGFSHIICEPNPRTLQECISSPIDPDDVYAIVAREDGPHLYERAFLVDTFCPVVTKPVYFNHGATIVS